MVKRSRPTQAAIAAHIDLSLTKTREYIRQGVIPKGADLDTARVAYLRHLRKRKAGVTDERARLDAARADLAELEAAKRRRELVPDVDVAEALLAVSGPMAAALEGLHVRATPAVRAAATDAEAADVLKRFVDQIRRDLADLGAAYRRKFKIPSRREA